MKCENRESTDEVVRTTKKSRRPVHTDLDQLLKTTNLALRKRLRVGETPNNGEGDGDNDTTAT